MSTVTSWVNLTIRVSVNTDCGLTPHKFCSVYNYNAYAIFVRRILFTVKSASFVLALGLLGLAVALKWNLPADWPRVEETVWWEEVSENERRWSRHIHPLHFRRHKRRIYAVCVPLNAELRELRYTSGFVHFRPATVAISPSPRSSWITTTWRGNKWLHCIEDDYWSVTARSYKPDTLL